MGCETAFTDYLAKCETSIDVYAQLSPLTSYTWIITDKHNRKYSAEFTTDGDGFWEIDVDDLPDGLLTEYGGTFILEVIDSGCKPVKFKAAGEYTKINFEIFGGTFPKATLGCSFECTGVSGSASTIVDYESVDEKTITYTAGMLAAYGNAPQVSVYSLVSGTTYELIAAPISQTFTGDVLTSISVGNLTGLTGYIIIS